MKLPPIQADPSSQRPGRASELVAAVLPPARTGAPDTAPERAGRRAPVREPVAPLRREALMGAYLQGRGDRMAAAELNQRARRAVTAYGQVARGERLQDLTEMLGVSLYV